MPASRSRSAPPATTPARRAGLITRVSTDRQARNDEGSLTTQLQRLRQHIEYKRSAVGEDWEEAAVYELRAVSGKDSLRSPQFERLFADIRSGRVNTVLCTSLDRICRSVKDFLHFFEVLNEHGVEFVCLKQNYDTTSPQGRLFVTIMMALAEFEREQTSERTRESTAARTERGLWNGGRLLGFDLNPERKGYLIPNEREAAIVDFAFDSYLEHGSFSATAAALNRAGYRTKVFESRRGKHHAAREFSLTTVQHVLKNVAYIGKKEIAPEAEGETARLVDAVWPAIVTEEKFWQVQRLIDQNARSMHNSSKPLRHVYVLSRGLLHCGRCDSAMEGRSGKGRGGVRYFYYACRRKGCALRVVAAEIESAVLERLGQLASDESIVEALVAETTRRRQGALPALKRQVRGLKAELDEVRSDADRLLGEWGRVEGEASRTFVRERLEELGRRRDSLQIAISDAEAQIAASERPATSPSAVRDALAHFNEIYDCLKPYERQELVRLLLRRAEVGDREIVLEINEGACTEVQTPAKKSASRFELPNWLPGLVSQSVIRYSCAASFRHLRPSRLSPPPDRRTGLIESGAVATRADLARKAGVSRARVTQVLGARARARARPPDGLPLGMLVAEG